MKRFIVKLLAPLAICVPLAAESMTVEPDAGSTGPGMLIGVNVVLSGLGAAIAPSVSAVSFDLTFNPAVLAFQSAVFGDPALSPTNQLDLNAVGVGDTFSAIAGTVSSFYVSFDDPADLVDLQQDTFRFVRMMFLATYYGFSELNITNLSILDEGSPPADIATAFTVTGSSVTVVPEPASICLLMVVAGSVVFGLRRRFR